MPHANGRITDTIDIECAKIQIDSKSEKEGRRSVVSLWGKERGCY